MPRGHLMNPLRERNAQVNELLRRKLSVLSRVQLVDAESAGFVLPDGTISHLDMYDYLHLTPRGYRRVFEPVYDLLLQLLAESTGDETAASGNDLSTFKGSS